MVTILDKPLSLEELDQADVFVLVWDGAINRLSAMLQAGYVASTDKPLIAILRTDKPLPAKLAKIADIQIHYDGNDAKLQRAVSAAIDSLVPKDEGI